MKLINIILICAMLLACISSVDAAGTTRLSQVKQPGDTDFNFGDHNITVARINGTLASDLANQTYLDSNDTALALAITGKLDEDGENLLSNVLNKSSTTYANETAINVSISNLGAGQVWQNTSLTNNGLAHTAINSSKANMLNGVLNKTGGTMSGDIAMGAYNITGAGNVNATAVYSGGELQRNQTMPYTTLVDINGGYVIVSDSDGDWIYTGTAISEDEAAIRYAMSQNGVTQLSDDTFYASNLNISIYSSLRGMGKQRSVITQNANLPVINIKDQVYYTSFSDLSFKSNLIYSEPAIHIDPGTTGNTGMHSFDRVYFRDFAAPAIDANSFNWGLAIRDCAFIYCGSATKGAIDLGASAAYSHPTTNVEITKCLFEPNMYADIVLRDSVTGVQISHSWFEGHLVDTVNQPMTAHILFNLSISGGIRDINIHDNDLVDTATATCTLISSLPGTLATEIMYRINIHDNSLVTVANRAGMNLTGLCYSEIHHNHVWGPDVAMYAIRILQHSVAVDVSNNIIEGGGVLVNDGYGYIHDNTITKGRVVLQYADSDTKVSNNQLLETHSSVVTSNSAASVYVVDNRILGTISCDANTILARNVGTGCKTENSGASSVLSGQDHVHVTHGLVSTPIADKIRITPKENFHGMYWWVDTIGATEFLVNLNGTAPEDLDFGWSIN